MDRAGRGVRSGRDAYPREKLLIAVKRMRRQIIISVAALVLVGAAVGVWWTGQTVPAYATGRGHFYVIESSYAFSPSSMTWHVGERVSLTLVNDDQSDPPKPGSTDDWSSGLGRV